ncbi:MAG: hypothetical protein IKS88_03850 [Clostridia bacterium]|nr:hypothetical protein [Clostridia bacterium]
MKLTEMIEHYNYLLGCKDQLNAQLKDINEEIELKRAELADAMIDADIPKVTHLGYSWSVGTKTRFSKKAGADEELFEMLRDNGLGDIIKETVNAQTLQGTMSGIAAENDGELPDEWKDVINVYEFNDITRRKSAK